MKYIMSFAMEHPYLFTLIMMFLSTWTPIEISKHYVKVPDEYKLDEWKGSGPISQLVSD